MLNKAELRDAGCDINVVLQGRWIIVLYLSREKKTYTANGLKYDITPNGLKYDIEYVITPL